jgi:WD40 repeat protein
VYSPDGRLIATAGADNEPVRVWNAETGEESVVIELQGNFTWALAFSPDSSRLAIGTWVSGAQVWDTTTGEEIYSFARAGNFVPDLAYTPDGQYIITAGSGGLKVWRAEDGEEVLTLNDDPIRWLTISPDGRTVYTVDFREVVRGFTLQLEDTVALAHERLTRWWRPEECQRYLRTAECPPAPPKFSE